MALLMSLILGSGLSAFTSNTAFAQNYVYENEISKQQQQQQIF
jgi:hypothetical protein